MAISPFEVDINQGRDHGAALKEEYEHLTIPNHTLITRVGPNEELFVVLGIEDHTNNPESLTLEQIGDTWWFFYGSTEGKPRVIVGEGNAPLNVYSDHTFDEAMAQVNGEQSVLRKLAQDYNIEFVSPDVGYLEAHLLPPTLSVEDAVLYYFMRNGPQVYRSGVPYNEAARSYLQARLRELEIALCAPTNSRFHGFNFAYDNMTHLYEARYGKPFTTTDGEFLTQETVGHLFRSGHSLAPDESKVSLVSREVNRLRRENLLTLYEKLWEEGKSVYSIFGEPHIVEIEGKLRKLGEPLQTIYSNHPTARDVESGKILLS